MHNLELLLDILKKVNKVFLNLQIIIIMLIVLTIYDKCIREAPIIKSSLFRGVFSGDTGYATKMQIRILELEKFFYTRKVLRLFRKFPIYIVSNYKLRKAEKRI